MPKRTIRNFVCRTGESIYSGAAKAGLKGHSHIRCAARCCGVLAKACKKVKVAHTRLPSAEVPELIPILGSQPAGDVSHKRAVGCHYLPSGLQLPPQPLRGLLPGLLLDEQRHDGCEQFA